MIGSWGPIIFEASSELVRTFSDMTSRRKMRLAEHQIFGKKPRLENLGPELVTQSLTIRLDKRLGIDPLTEWAAIIREFIKGADHPLIIGEQIHAFFVIESMSETHRNINERGEISAIDVLIEFKEDPYD